MKLLRQGTPVVVSAPSGAGKTTLCHRVMQRLVNVELSVSYTTRQPRAGERDGVDYHFVDVVTFRRMIAEAAFLEWAEVHGNLYGTSLHRATARLQQGVDIVFVIDVQGGAQIAKRLPEAVLVFVVPPSLRILEARLRGRGSDAEADIARRLQVAGAETRQATLYTHWLVNDDLDEAVRDLEAILRAERLRRVDKQALVERVLQP